MNFSGQSDSAQRFSVQSNLIYTVWQSKAAYCGLDAQFELRTSLVGDGAQVKIKGKTENGRNLGTINVKIYGNRLKAAFPIPQNAPVDDLAYLEVHLSRHKLQGETNRIPIRPQIQVQQMQWSAPEARRGDVVTLTVNFQSAIPNDTDAIIAIYEFDHNGSDHDPVVRIPTTVQNNRIQVQWEYEHYDDTGEIPTQFDLQPHNQGYNHPEYFFIVSIDEIKIGTNQESGLLKFKDGISIRVVNLFRDPVPNAQYKIRLSDNTIRTGSADQNGMIEIDNLPPGPYSVDIL